MRKKGFITRSVCLLAVFLVLSANICLASVTGTVTDTAGNPVSGALITFTDESNPENEYSSYTDNDGKYTIFPVMVKEEIPSGFRLFQNYPNPFNPTTTIPYSLENAGFVTLSIYNVLGQKVRTLIDGYQSGGEHKITWDACDDKGKSVSAGMYIYQLKSGGNVASKKLLLIDGGINSTITGTTQMLARGGSTAKTANISESTTYRVTITGEDIVTYEESGITLIDGETYDFEVIRIIVIDFVIIPAVTEPYEMASGYTVTISEYKMSATEVTNAQYAEYLHSALVMGYIEIKKSGDVYGKTGDWLGQCYLNIGFGGGDNMCWINYSDSSFIIESGKEDWPVVAVTWYGSKAFAEYYGFDLPTEAEWQYAACGGKNYEYGTDDGTISSSNANYDKNVGHPTDVGSYPANPFGLYDMCGNVYEWCCDWLGSYPSGIVDNPTGAQTGSLRIKRGGNWNISAIFCRSGSDYRAREIPSYMNHSIGFRVVSR